ncbi:Bacteriophage tail assembly protein [Serratia proteamaculans]|uniref:tail fiber assembly protein n=1 Tax=Serratia proteamaculans TaxID=28151 RepID=UPI00217836CF|nr:tail fiber assembly protein [Serratia proteamaculans]CAI1722974.1 Bacteriophage tail assembly protein [Serratia proteamaculans]
MKSFGPFSTYKPEKDTSEALLAESSNILFIKDENENDWYEVQKSFNKDTLKIAFDQNGFIYSASYDASSLWPINAFIAEVVADDIPDTFSIPIKGLDWQFNGEKIVPRIYTTEQLKIQAQYEKDTRLNLAAKEIAPLKDAVDLDIATPVELELLKIWMLYRVKLSRVDLGTAPDIDWPQPPQ